MSRLFPQSARLAGILLLAFLAACSSPQRHPAVPLDHEKIAAVPGFDHIRWWGDVGDDPTFLAAANDTIRRERLFRSEHHLPGLAPDVAYLAISGGGQNGAFGAGLLCGWTEAGTRPDFNVVTGVSTGALIAPFAFAGPAYDHVLRTVYTSICTADIMEDRGLLQGFFSDALSDTAPLRKLLNKYIDDAFIQRIADEYATGGLLLIGTTDLDAGRPVVWDIGAIAASGNPGSRKLIIDLMIASSAIPAFFPPVMLDIPIEGTPYQEMHVDGGAATQVFIFPASFHLRDFVTSSHAQRNRTAYIVRNSRLDPEWAETRPRTMSIAQRAISSLIQTQGLGDLYRLYLHCTRDGINYRLASIPASFRETAQEPFDPKYMGKLFEVGYQFGKSQSEWRTAPPGFENDDQAN